MSYPSLKTPQFSQGSYSERAAHFFTDDQAWEPLSGRTDTAWLGRVMTWAHYPNRYWLRQVAEQTHHSFNRVRLNHRLFEVSLISAKRSSDGMREFEQWYIVQPNEFPESVMHVQQIVDEPEVEGTKKEMNTNFSFIVDNGLYMPNEEDMLKLDYILTLGYMDGTDTLRQIH